MGSLVTEAKGQFAQMLASTLLEWSGYRVVRFGVEETVSEVKATLARGEPTIRLPQQLRSTPDFLVIDTVSGDSMLLEVKFRRTFDDAVARELHSCLSAQARWWPEAATMVVVADPPGLSGEQYQDFIRIIMPDELPLLATKAPASQRWTRLATIGSVFSAVHEVPRFHAEADQLIGVIRAWR